MFSKFATGIAGFALIVALGMVAMTQADAGRWCYKTGPNTVQCVGR